MVLRYWLIVAKQISAAVVPVVPVEPAVPLDPVPPFDPVPPLVSSPEEPDVPEEPEVPLVPERRAPEPSVLGSSLHERQARLAIKHAHALASPIEKTPLDMEEG